MDQRSQKEIQDLRVLGDNKEVSIYKDKDAYLTKIYLSAIDYKTDTLDSYCWSLALHEDSSSPFGHFLEDLLVRTKLLGLHTSPQFWETLCRAVD